jgi:DUF1016 N-terminal domain
VVSPTSASKMLVSTNSSGWLESFVRPRRFKFGSGNFRGGSLGESDATRSVVFWGGFNAPVDRNCQKFVQRKKPGAPVPGFALNFDRTFPLSVGGFSAANLWRIRQFYEAYAKDEKLAPLVREISWTKNVLIHQIENKTYEKTLLNQTNFEIAIRERIRNRAEMCHKSDPAPSALSGSRRPESIEPIENTRKHANHRSQSRLGCKRSRFQISAARPVPAGVFQIVRAWPVVPPGEASFETTRCARTCKHVRFRVPRNGKIYER